MTRDDIIKLEYSRLTNKYNASAIGVDELAQELGISLSLVYKATAKNDNTKSAVKYANLKKQIPEFIRSGGIRFPLIQVAIFITNTQKTWH